jgi:asparagine synthase (glutamine-hydrolysing)
MSKDERVVHSRAEDLVATFSNSEFLSKKMCGIAGKLDFSGAIVPETIIRRMCAPIVHRGPDAEGFHTGPYIGLGQCRLSIIDLTEEANPPLGNEDNSIWIVFNGEIYNFRELRSELLKNDHIFRTKCDTEVILHLYEKYGTGCLKYLRGMFALAIWDSRKRLLFAARDRLGKKPFFYTKTPTGMLFGSSIGVIIADPDVSRKPNFAAIDSYLANQYVPSPLTAFSGILKLPPAHYLVCDAKGDFSVERYWCPPEAEKTTASEQEVQEELMRLLRQSVRLRLVSDVPLGVFLSGGIDSGVVTALVATETSSPVKTFSIGFEEQDFDELSYARTVAERYGTDHHEFVVKPSAADILPLLVKHYGEPFADSSAIPTYHVSRMAREHITVALSGDGGDESFSGYQHYRSTECWQRVDLVPVAVRRHIAGLMESALGTLPYSNLTARTIRGWHMIGSSLPERYRTQLSIVKDEEKDACYTPHFWSLLSENNVAAHYLDLRWDKYMDSWDWMARHDQHYYLPDCLMVKTDIASMANGLEVRCPFLDHKVVEFAATIPSSMKRNGDSGKLILRRAVQNLLPEEVLRKRKTGFGVPLAKWLRTDLKDMLMAVLLDEKAKKRGLFEPSFLKKMIEEHAERKRDWSTRLWAFLFLELWLREYVD